MQELIDIYDANCNPEGQMERSEAHLNARWHCTYHCWVVSSASRGSLLFQRRSPTVANFPNLLDVSAAGHLHAGEVFEHGVREVSEELGIEVQPERLHALGRRVEVSDRATGERDREHQAVFMLREDLPLAQYRPDHKEVAGLYWFAIPAGLALFGGSRASAALTGIEYDNGRCTWKAHNLTVNTTDFVPRLPNYYLTMFIMAERLLEGRFPIAVS